MTLCNNENRVKAALKTRVQAWFALVFFSVNAVFWDIPLHAQVFHPFAVNPEISSPAPLWKIPADLGSLHDIHRPSLNEHRPFVIHIQDAHSNPEAQRKIHGLLHYFMESGQGNRKWFVGVEGAHGKIFPEYLDFFPQYPDINDYLIQVLLEKGELTGAELFAWDCFQKAKQEKKSEEIPVFGIEEAGLYRENLENYRELLSEQDQVRKSLTLWKRHLETAKSLIFSPDLKKFIREKERRKDGDFQAAFHASPHINSPELHTYLRFLFGQAKNIIKVDLLHHFEQIRFPNLARLALLDRIEARHNAEEGQRERVEILKGLSEEEDRPEILEVIEQVRNLESATEPRAVTESLWKIAEDSQFPIEDYESFWALTATIILKAEIHMPELFAEMEQLEEWVLQRLTRTEEERRLILFLEDFLILKRLITLTLTREDYLKFSDEITQGISPEEYLTQKIQKAVDEIPLEIDAELLESLIGYAKKAMIFYEGAERRDQTMLNNTLDFMSKDQVAVLISGGFHTFGMTQLMKEQEVGYVVIQPRLESSDHGERYHRVLQNENADLSAYFDGQYLTKQEAIYLKLILEIGIPKLWEQPEISDSQIGEIVAGAINRHPVLSQRIKANAIDLQGHSKLRIELFNGPNPLASAGGAAKSPSQALAAALLTDDDHTAMNSEPLIPKPLVMIEIFLDKYGRDLQPQKISAGLVEAEKIRRNESRRPETRDYPEIGEKTDAIAVRHVLSQGTARLSDSSREATLVAVSRRDFLRIFAAGVTAFSLLPALTRTQAQSQLPSFVEQGRATFRGMQTLVAPSTGLIADKARVAGFNGVRLQPREVDFMKTSPTNIGLQILSIVIARENGWIEIEAAQRQLTRIVENLEKMERERGFWFNWYDLRTLNDQGVPEVTLNRFLSSVDNGNLAASLMVLHEAVQGTPLSDRVEDLLKAQDWNFFYNQKQGLISHGFDSSRGRLTPYNYGIFNTEARLTVFLSVLEGVDDRVWHNMRRDVLIGEEEEIPVVASWGGSLFEALFADVFLGAPGEIGKNNLNTIQIHRNKADQLDLPIWGWSPGLDTVGLYQEFGVPEIGLRNSGRGYPVGEVTPYSILLAAPYAPDGVRANLERMMKLRPEVYHPAYGYRDSINPRTGRLSPDILSLDKGLELAGLDMLLRRNNREQGTVERYFWDYLEKAGKAEQGHNLLRQEEQRFLDAKKAVEKQAAVRKLNFLAVATSAGDWYAPGNGSVLRRIISDPERGEVLEIEYDVRPRGAFNGTFYKQDDINPTQYAATHLIIGVRGMPGEPFSRSFKVELKRDGRILQDVIVNGVTDGWKDFVFPLKSNIGTVDEVTVVFENRRVGEKAGRTIMSDISLGIAPRSESREIDEDDRKALIHPNATYAWGTGYFRDIADIRRRVYTTYYTLDEHGEQMREVLGYRPEEHLRQLLAEIENPMFHIDNRNYEEIKAYLWQRAQEIYPKEIADWSQEKSNKVIQQGLALVRSLEPELTLPARQDEDSLRQFWHQAILRSAALNLFDVLEERNPDGIREEVSVMLEKEDQATGINVPIDFSNIFMDRIVRRPGEIVILTGDINSIGVDLKLYGETLMNQWLEQLKQETGISNAEALIEEARKRGYKITFFANRLFAPRNNNLVVQRNATYAEMISLIESPELKTLEKFRKEGLIEVASFSSEYPGTVLSDLERNLSPEGEKARAILGNADAVIALGEQNNVTLSGLNIDSFRIAPIRDFAHIFYTGIKHDRDNFKYPHFSILYVPAGLHAAIDWFPDIPTRLNAFQFYSLHQLLPREKWEALVRLTRAGKDGNILEIALQSGLLTAEEEERLRQIQGPTLEDRVETARRLVGEYSGHYERVVTPVDRFRERVMHVLHFPQDARNGQGEKLRLAVQYAQDAVDFRGQAKSKMTFLDLLMLQPKALFAFDFLYFITRNLISYFNKSNPHFALGPRFFGEGIGFMKAKVNGEEVLYPPLFNKGAIGQKKDGTFVFGRIRMPAIGQVTLPIGNSRKTLAWTHVNPHVLADYDAPVIFTPFDDSFRDSSARAPHTFGETRGMYFLPENDRYNFVMINNKLLGVVRGRTEIPAFGTVLSVAPNAFSAEERTQLDKMAVRDQIREVRDFETVSFKFSLDPKWDNTEWIMGGALLMVDDGKVEKLHYDPAGPKDTLYHLEGWALESSQRTQETPVEPELNEARSTVGLTEDGQFFVAVIEGRANNRTGATHQETVDWLQEYFRKKGTRLRYALDLDSASSVALGFVENGKFQLLNQTARGSDSKIGDMRYYNHVAYLQPTAVSKKGPRSESRTGQLRELIHLMANRDELPERADLLLVFGSGDMQVPEQAARLYHDGKTERILVAGRFGPWVEESPEGNFGILKGEKVYPEALLYQQKLIERGVPAEKILVEDQSQTMEQNAQNSLALLRENAIDPQSVIFMHSPFLEHRGSAAVRATFPAGVKFFDYAAYIPDIPQDPESLSKLEKDVLRQADKLLQSGVSEDQVPALKRIQAVYQALVSAQQTVGDKTVVSLPSKKRTLTQALGELKRQYRTLPEEGEELRASFLKFMKEELPGQEVMIRNHQQPRKAQDGAGRDFLDLDIGGTNLRVTRKRQNPDGTFQIIQAAAYQFTDEDKKKNLEEFMLEVAKHIKSVMRAGESYELEVTWSWPVDLTGINAGLITGLSKGWKIPDAVGQDLGMALQNALFEVGVGGVNISVIQNDTTRALVHGNLREPKTRLGVVASTGFNIAYFERLFNITKNQEDSRRWEAVNTEFGAAPVDNKFIPSLVRKVDEESENTGEHRLEKMISAKYLAAQVRLAVADLIEEGLLFPKAGKQHRFLSVPDALDPLFLSYVMSDSAEGLPRVQEALAKAGIQESTLEERKAIQEIVQAVVRRSAFLLANAIAAAIEKGDPHLGETQAVALDSSLYDKMPGYAQWLDHFMNQIFGEKSKNYKLFSINKASAPAPADASRHAETRRPRSGGEVARNRSESREDIREMFEDDAKNHILRALESVVESFAEGDREKIDAASSSAYELARGSFSVESKSREIAREFYKLAFLLAEGDWGKAFNASLQAIHRAPSFIDSNADEVIRAAYTVAVLLNNGDEEKVFQRSLAAMGLPSSRLYLSREASEIAQSFYTIALSLAGGDSGRVFEASLEAIRETPSLIDSGAKEIIRAANTIAIVQRKRSEARQDFEIISKSTEIPGFQDVPEGRLYLDRYAKLYPLAVQFLRLYGGGKEEYQKLREFSEFLKTVRLRVGPTGDEYVDIDPQTKTLTINRDFLEFLLVTGRKKIFVSFVAAAAQRLKEGLSADTKDLEILLTGKKTSLLLEGERMSRLDDTKALYQLKKKVFANDLPGVTERYFLTDSDFQLIIADVLTRGKTLDARRFREMLIRDYGFYGEITVGKAQSLLEIFHRDHEDLVTVRETFTQDNMDDLKRKLAPGTAIREDERNGEIKKLATTTKVYGMSPRYQYDPAFQDRSLIWDVEVERQDEVRFGGKSAHTGEMMFTPHAVTLPNFFSHGEIFQRLFESNRLKEDYLPALEKRIEALRAFQKDHAEELNVALDEASETLINELSALRILLEDEQQGKTLANQVEDLIRQTEDLRKDMAQSDAETLKDYFMMLGRVVDEKVRDLLDKKKTAEAQRSKLQDAMTEETRSVLETEIRHLTQEIIRFNEEYEDLTSKESRKMLLGARNMVLPDDLMSEMKDSLRLLAKRLGIKDIQKLVLAIRSSGVGEDSESASFAGRQDTYIFQRPISTQHDPEGLESLIRSWIYNQASLFNKRAINYRFLNDLATFDEEVEISTLFQQMFLSNRSFIAFSVDRGTGFPSISTQWMEGQGEQLVSGDESGSQYVHTYDGRLLVRQKGDRKFKIVETATGLDKQKVPVSEEERKEFAMTDLSALSDASRYFYEFHKFYGPYVDLEGAVRPKVDENGNIIYLKDPETGELLRDARGNPRPDWTIVSTQARPETVFSQIDPNEIKLRRIVLTDEAFQKAERDGRVLDFDFIAKTGGAAQGEVQWILDKEPETMAKAQDRIMIAEQSDPDMESAMRAARGIIALKGGQNSHTMIVASEFGLVAITGVSKPKKFMEAIANGQELTIDAERGKVLMGFDHEVQVAGSDFNVRDIPDVKPGSTRSSTIVATVEKAFRQAALAKIPSYKGIGLMRLEIALAQIGIYPELLLAYDKYKKAQKGEAVEGFILNEQKHGEYIRKVEEAITGFNSGEDFYVSVLSEWIRATAEVLTPPIEEPLLHAQKIVQDDVRIKAVEIIRGYYEKGLGYSEPLKELHALKEKLPTDSESIKHLEAVIGLLDKRLYIRLDDRKSDEYKNVLGAGLFIKEELNPMKGWRGLDLLLATPETFRWQLEAIRRVAQEKKNKIGVFAPVVRRPQDVTQMLHMMDDAGLTRDLVKRGMMTEIPTNSINIEDFLRTGIDFISTGGNDGLQTVAAIDRNTNDPYLKAEMGDFGIPVLRWNAFITRKIREFNEVSENDFKCEAGFCGNAVSVPGQSDFAVFLREAGYDSSSTTIEAFEAGANALTMNKSLAREGILTETRFGFHVDPRVRANAANYVQLNIKDLRLNLGFHYRMLQDHDAGRLESSPSSTEMFDFIRRMGFEPMEKGSGLRAYQAYVEKEIEQAAKAVASQGRHLVVGTDDGKSNEYRALIGGEVYEPNEANPDFGVHGLVKVLNHDLEFFEAELNAIRKIQEEGHKIGLTLRKARNHESIKKVKDLLVKNQLNGLSLGLDVQVYANIVTVDEILNSGIQFLSVPSQVQLASELMALEQNNANGVQIRPEDVAYQLNRSLQVLHTAARKLGVTLNIDTDHTSRIGPLARAESRIDIPFLDKTGVLNVANSMRAFSEYAVMARQKIGDLEEDFDVREMFQVAVLPEGFLIRPIQEVYGKMAPRRKMTGVIKQMVSQIKGAEAPESLKKMIDAFRVSISVSNHVLYDAEKDLEFVLENYAAIIASFERRHTVLSSKGVNAHAMHLILEKSRVTPRFPSGKLIQMIVEPYNQIKHKADIERAEKAGRIINQNQILGFKGRNSAILKLFNSDFFQSLELEPEESRDLALLLLSGRYERFWETVRQSDKGSLPEEIENRIKQLTGVPQARSEARKPDLTRNSIESVVASTLPTRQAVEQAIFILRRSEKKRALENSVVRVSRQIGILPDAETYAGNRNLNLKEALETIVFEILADEFMDEEVQRRVIEIVHQAVDAIPLKGEERRPVHVQAVSTVEEFSDKLSDNLYAFAAMLIANPKDRHSAYLLAESEKVAYFDTATAKQEFETILKKLVGTSILADRLNIQIFSNRQDLIKQILRDATRSQGEGLEVSVLADREELLHEVRSLIQAKRINRTGVGMAESAFFTGTTLREQPAESGEVINLQQELEELGISSDSAARVAQVIQAVKRLATAA